MNDGDYYNLRVRMSKDEARILEEAARNDGRSRNGFLRRLIRDLKQPAREARLFERHGVKEARK